MSENDNNFEALRRLLALKRHEIPPPGYFDDFSSHVIARIRASQAVRKTPWLLRFFQAFESQPAYPVAFASSLCLLLLFGIVSVEQNPKIAPVAMQPAQYDFNIASATSPNVDAKQPLLAVVGVTNSPSDAQSASLFDPQSNSYFHQVDFQDGN